MENSSNQKRILGYGFARELTREEISRISGGTLTRTRVTTGDDRHETTDSFSGDK